MAHSREDKDHHLALVIYTEFEDQTDEHRAITKPFFPHVTARRSGTGAAQTKKERAVRSRKTEQAMKDKLSPVIDGQSEASSIIARLHRLEPHDGMSMSIKCAAQLDGYITMAKRLDNNFDAVIRIGVEIRSIRCPR